MVDSDDIPHDDIAEDLLDGLTKIRRDSPKIIDVSIIYDTKQYSIRIPKKFADSLNIDTSNDKFRFEYIPSIIEGEKKEKPKLKGELIQK